MFRGVAALASGAMADINVSSTSEDGFATTSQVGGFELTVDATGEEGPDPNGTLVADYASCYIPAFRVGGQQRDHDDLGRIEIDAEADIDDDEDLEAIRFDMRVEADLDGDEEELVERGEDICHVHAALREELHADISLESNAF
jgi:uncharacterized OsmC-like protein